MGGHDVKILVAEDNQLLAEAIGDLFAEANDGHPVFTARNVREAVEVARREAPDLVVIDHSIGRGDLEGAVRAILVESPRSSVFVMTTRVDETMSSRITSLGASCIDKETLHERASELVDSVREP